MPGVCGLEYQDNYKFNYKMTKIVLLFSFSKGYNLVNNSDTFTCANIS